MAFWMNFQKRWLLSLACKIGASGAGSLGSAPGTCRGPGAALSCGGAGRLCLAVLKAAGPGNFRSPERMASGPGWHWAARCPCARHGSKGPGLTLHGRDRCVRAGRKKFRAIFLNSGFKNYCRGEKILLRKTLHNIIHLRSFVLLGNISEELEQSGEGRSP